MPRQQIVSPLPGTFYRRPSPDQPPYKEEGDSVEVGDTVGLVEVMKLFYEVKSDQSGTIGKYLVGNEDTVTAGQPLVDLGE